LSTDFLFLSVACIDNMQTQFSQHGNQKTTKDAASIYESEFDKDGV